MQRGEALLVLAVLALTGWALVATPRSCPPGEDRDFRWHAEGDCGVSGPLHIFTRQNRCGDWQVEGSEALQLPPSVLGPIGTMDLTQGGWSMYGAVFLVDGGVVGADASVHIERGRPWLNRQCVAATDAGPLQLGCDDAVGQSGSAHVCTFTLTPR